MHMIVRIPEKVERKERSVEERLQFLEDEVLKMSQALVEMRRLVEDPAVAA